ncbi:penicillin amidase [Compostimonas suwonensis]|uniref:Penicillin amidase n=2 Tax=Compostimonas suwonensis TaxID=1048394 RepID=A0A2M9BUT5_9MICO|nr:penicillin amidase [Compostimonas suwonensis]
MARALKPSAEYLEVMWSAVNESHFSVAGLSADVEIVVDEWGIPHIYAASSHDVFLAQGFNAARDRLFQMDLWRRRGLGLLSAAFGPAFVEQDRAARLFLYRGDLRAEWLAYGSDTKDVTTAFVAGVNAFVSLCLADPRQLPPEFEALGYLPERWEPTDIPRIRSHGIYHNAEQELARALALRDFGPEAEDLRRVRDPQNPVLVPSGLDLSVLCDEVLDVYRLATGPVNLGTPQAGESPEPQHTPEGSNNWVLGGSRTASGRPLLANDPHRAVTLPSLRYISHLSAPGLDVIGGGEPVLPGVSIGHNGHVAFGLTIFPIDQEDIYVYELNPRNDLEYRYRDGWERMTVVTETIPVRDADPQTVELRYTRHGPVVFEREGTAVAIRAAWLEPGMAPYLGSMEYMRAHDAAEFNSAMNRWGAPGENQVYAMPDGTIGWRPGGLLPIRPNWDGLLPVPGDGRYEWAGFHDNDVLPRDENPDRDWLATANEFNLPHGFDETIGVGYDWYSPDRAERIRTVLAAAQDWTVDDCLRLQTDYLSTPFQKVAPLLAELRPASPELHRALDLLGAWDGVEDEGSAPAALFEIWFRNHLRPQLLVAALERRLPPDVAGRAAARLIPQEQYSGDPRIVLRMLADPERHLGSSEALTVILERSLLAAVREAEDRLGPDAASWAWGTLHFALLEHPAHRLLPKLDGARLGPIPRSGGSDTVGSTAFSPDFRQVSGASFRVVIDVGDWDGSVAVNVPGQSGVPGSRHYSDHLEGWNAGAAFPLLYSRAAVDAAASSRIVLSPA